MKTMSRMLATASALGFLVSIVACAAPTVEEQTGKGEEAATCTTCGDDPIEGSSSGGTSSGGIGIHLPLCVVPAFVACTPKVGSSGWNGEPMDSYLQAAGCLPSVIVTPANNEAEANDWEISVCPRSTCAQLNALIAQFTAADPLHAASEDPAVIESCLLSTGDPATAADGTLAVAHYRGDRMSPNCPSCAPSTKIF